MKCPSRDNYSIRRRRRYLSECFSNASLTLLTLYFLLSAFKTDSHSSHAQSRTPAMIPLALLFSGTIAAASALPQLGSIPSQKPISRVKRQNFQTFFGRSVYPYYYVEHPLPPIDSRKELPPASFLIDADWAGINSFSNNLNKTDGKTGAVDAKKSDKFTGDDSKSKYFLRDRFGNINIFNPFLAAKDVNGQLLKVASGVPGVKAVIFGEGTSKSFSIVNPFHKAAGHDPVFGPELAPRVDIHYHTPQGLNVGPIAPGYNSFPFIPGFDGYGQKHSIGGNKSDGDKKTE